MSHFDDPSKFSGLVVTLGIKTLKLRYKNSLLGFMWSLLNPLIYLIIFSVVFGRVFPEIDRYPLYALTGLLFWVFFSTTTIQVIESITNNRGVLKSINVPTIAFPLSAQFASLMSLFLTLIPFTVLMFIFGMKPGWEMLLFIPILILCTGFTLGISLILTSFNVYFRDIQMAWSSFMPAIFYITPIAYTSKLVPENFLWIIKLNPLYHFINALRQILYYNTFPSATEMGILLLLGTVPLVAGYYIFKKLEQGFVSQY